MKVNLEKLSECEHEQIYKIIHKHTDHFTCSDSGVLISADNLPVECLDEIEKYINFCFAQKMMLDADEAHRTALFKTLRSE